MTSRNTSGKRPRLFRSRPVQILSAVVLIAFAGIVISAKDPAGVKSVTSDKAVVHGTVARLGSRLDGRVQRIPVEPGAQVEEGDVIAELDNAHLKAQVEEQRADLARARQEREAKRLAISHDRRRLDIAVDQAKASVAVAKAKLDARGSQQSRWAREHERISVLAKEDAASQRRLDDVEASLGSAAALEKAGKAQLRSARIDLENTVANRERLAVQEAELRTLDAEVEFAAAALADAKATLEASKLRAPGNGRVVDWIAAPGASVRAGEPVVGLWLEDRFWIEAWVDEDAVASIRNGQEVAIELSAFPQHTLEGRVQSIQIAMDGGASEAPGSSVSPLLPEEKRFAVRVAVEKKPAALRLLPGLSATVQIGDVSPVGESLSSAASSASDLVVRVGRYLGLPAPAAAKTEPKKGAQGTGKALLRPAVETRNLAATRRHRR